MKRNWRRESHRQIESPRNRRAKGEKIRLCLHPSLRVIVTTARPPQTALKYTGDVGSFGGWGDSFVKICFCLPNLSFDTLLPNTFY